MQKSLYNSYLEQMKFQTFSIAFSLLYVLTTKYTNTIYIGGRDMLVEIAYTSPMCVSTTR